MQIECCALTKAYDGKTVLCDLNWQIEAGELWCIRGPSGIGKTTLLRLILGLEKPDSGSIYAAGNLRSAPVSQEDRLLIDRTAAQNCEIFCRAPQEDIRVVLNDLFDASDVLEKPVGQLSGGMRRRVALARALLAPSDVLCLDEPFAGLDPETRMRAWQAVKRWRNGRTVLLVSHEFAPTDAKYLDLT